MNTQTAIVLFVACTAFLAGCQAPPATPQQRTEQAEQICQVYRSYLPARSYMNVLEECGHQLGEPYCRKCLSQ